MLKPIAKAGDYKMMLGQIEKEGLEQEWGVFGGRDYWDAVYLSEEERWEAGEENEDDFDTANVKAKVSDSLNP